MSYHIHLDSSPSTKRAAALVLLGMFLAGCNASAPSLDSEASGFVLQVTDQTFRQEVLEANEPVLVDMWAPWCQPCVEMKPELLKAGKLLQGEVKVVEVNVQENPFVEEKYGINQLPTLILFIDGKVMEQDVGKRSLDRLLEFVQPYRQEVKGSEGTAKPHTEGPRP